MNTANGSKPVCHPQKSNVAPRRNGGVFIA